MRKTLFTGLFLLFPSVALAQAQGGPDPAPTEPPKAEEKAPEAPAGEAPAPEAPAAAPEAPPEAPAEPPAAAGEASASAEIGLGATGEAGATASTEGDSVRSTPPSPVTRRGQESGDEDSWKFSYSGYLRAPMRIGVGKRLPEDTNNFTVSGTDTTLHEPIVPDDQYLSFQSTAHNKRSWAEGFFTYGNAWASGTIGVTAYNLTEAGFNDVDAQWGISQAYVTLTPDLGYENFRLWAKAGAIVDKYGMAGRYDAGEYDMYMFGRTHVMGETMHVEFDLTDAWTLYGEQGLGTKKPDPNQYNNARFTLLHHEHIGIKQGRNMDFAAHYMYSWSQEEFRPFSGTEGTARNGLPTGVLWAAGADARMELGAFGFLYAGYSHVGAEYAVTVSRALEVLHASGGGEFTLGVIDNYLESPNCGSAPGTSPAPPMGAPQGWQSLDPNGCSDGNGHLDAFQLQWEFSLTNFQQQIQGGQRFWGEGFDAILKLYGLLVLVNSDARDTTNALVTADFADATDPYKVTKLKYGADILVQALSWLSPGLRFDRVEPNNHFPEQSFAILSPRLEFKSKWVTHERITLQYSRYFYDARECPDTLATDAMSQFRCVQPPSAPVPYDGFGSSATSQDAGNRAVGTNRPDQNVFNLSATMWW